MTRWSDNVSYQLQKRDTPPDTGSPEAQTRSSVIENQVARTGTHPQPSEGLRKRETREEPPLPSHGSAVVLAGVLRGECL